MDTLATRYGWFYTDITEGLYWEDVYEMYEYASNLDIVEKNEQMKFNFMLHAQTKEALNSWKDTPIPFPDRTWTPPKKQAKRLPGKFGQMSNRTVASPEQQKRYHEVVERQRKHKEKVKEMELQRAYGNNH